MRLIDADRLKDAIHTDFSEHFTLYHDTDQTALIDMVMDDIDEMQTAFDKEKVIKKIKDESSLERFEDVGISGNVYGHYSKEVIDTEEAIEIVEKGGIE